MKKNLAIPAEVEELVDQVGGFIHYWGFKKVHGQIWCHLFLSETPLDAAALMARLRISKALVSISIRDLLEYDVIQEAGKGEKGTLLYRTNPNITDTIFNVLRRREKKMLSQINAAYRNVKNLDRNSKSDIAIEPERLSQLGNLITMAESVLEGVLSTDVVDLSSLQDFKDV